MFRTRQQIVDALERLEERPGSASTSVISVDHSAFDPDADPFHPGFLTAFERRTEVTRLLRGLDVRSQRLLILWFVHALPVVEIAAVLSISRVHCYRLRNKALEQMLLVSRGLPEDVPRAS